MLFKLENLGGELGSLEPLPYLDASDLEKLEKDIENLLAKHLLNVLFEDESLLPVFQERQLQAEADVYALNKVGDLVIFELKRGVAGGDAVLQVIRYAQTAGQWTFSELQSKYGTYLESNGAKAASLTEAHQVAFQLEQPLLPSDFNKRQLLYVVGNAADEALVRALDYWKRQGLPIEFVPYRIYSINAQHYFEFFSIPYDLHRNPAAIKGVLFDTNRSYDEDAIWEMMEKKRVSAYGEVKHIVKYLFPSDIVFYSHKNEGIVAAARVTGQVKKDGLDQEYRAVEFLTPVPERNTGVVKCMKFSHVVEVVGKPFFWARTIKVPYLSREEASGVLDELRKVLA